VRLARRLNGYANNKATTAMTNPHHPRSWTITPDLSNQAWLAVMIAFQAVEHIKGARALYLSGVLRDLPISDKSIEGIDVMQRDVTRGREALAPFAY
jgi:hypothetical protein